ncbi:hypothetical protein T492DRAFT_912463, partial [Pavlovales sp. CCMP2436]
MSHKFWSLVGSTLRSKKGELGQHAPATKSDGFGALRASPTFTALAFLQDGTGRLVSATARGELMLWEGNRLVHYVKASTLPIFAIVAWAGGVATGGKDGRVSLWPAEWPSMLEGQLAPIRVYELREMVRGFADAAGRPLALAGGTRTSEVFELAFEQGLDYPTLGMLAQGHAPSRDGGGLGGLIVARPSEEQMVTAGSDKTLRVWSAARTCMVGMRLLAAEACALAAAPAHASR